MQIESLSRRKFLVKTTMSALYAAAGSYTLGTAHAARPNRSNQGQAKRSDRLISQVLGFRVGGIERGNKIANRLAANFNRLSKDKYGNLLQQAALAAYELQRTPGVLSKGKQSVSSNLNLLLGQVYASDNGLGNSTQLGRAILSTTLFATHGVHHDVTRAAQKQARAATRALKDKNSLVPRAERLATKKFMQASYRSNIKMVVDSYNWLPETVKISRVWIMPRSLVG